MFEKATPVPHTQSARFAGQNSYAEEPLDNDAALRMFDWNELTARLGAARDLRRVLRRDTTRTIGDTAHDFADAAARYFRTKDEGKSNVNPVGLEHCKGSPGMAPELKGLRENGSFIRRLPQTGDAREY